MRKFLPPSHLLLALLVMTALHRMLPVYRYWLYPLTLLGLVPILLGVLLNLVADRKFGAQQTTVKPFEKSTALITTFPFSISRHPMYLGMVLMLLGVALFLGTASCLVPVVAFIYVMDRVFICVEEQMLEETFGTEWAIYMSKVRKWI